MRVCRRLVAISRLCKRQRCSHVYLDNARLCQFALSDLFYTERLRRVQWWKRRRHGTRPVQCLPSMSACCSCRRHWRRSSGAPHSLTCHHQPRDSLAEVLRMRSSLYKSRDSSKSLECSRYKHQVKLPRSVYLSHMLIAVTQACRICGDIELLQ